MALKSTYFLADVDGDLCVVCRSTDWNEPRYYLCHWPTKIRTYEFCRFFEVKPEELRTAVKIVSTMPGEFCIVEVNGVATGTSFTFARSCYLSLVNGARTESVKTTYEAVPVPRIGKGTRREWSDGRWRIYPPMGKPRTVEV